MLYAIEPIICILLILIFFIITYNQHKEQNSQVKTATEIISSVNPVKLARLPDDNPVILEAPQTPKRAESNIPHFDAHGIDSPKSIKEAVTSQNNNVVSEFQNEYKRDRMKHQQSNVSLQIEGSIKPETVRI